jgi:ketosteroid isomerase-like protein
LESFRAVADRDAERLWELFHPDVEFFWPPSLPYGGRFRGAGIADMSLAFAEVWDPLQPTDAERRMDPRVVASGAGEVVVQYFQRGIDANDVHFETEVLGLYEVSDAQLVRAQMFYFDPVGLERFIASAAT